MKTSLLVSLFLLAPYTTFAASSYVKIICHSKISRETTANSYVNLVRFSEKKLEGLRYSNLSSQSEVVVSVDLSHSTCVVTPLSDTQMR